MGYECGFLRITSNSAKDAQEAWKMSLVQYGAPDDEWHGEAIDAEDEYLWSWCSSGRCVTRVIRDCLRDDIKVDTSDTAWVMDTASLLAIRAKLVDYLLKNMPMNVELKYGFRDIPHTDDTTMLSLDGVFVSKVDEHNSLIRVYHDEEGWYDNLFILNDDIDPDEFEIIRNAYNFLDDFVKQEAKPNSYIYFYESY